MKNPKHSFACPSLAFCSSFHPSESIIASSCIDGEIAVHCFVENTTRETVQFSNHNAAVRSITFTKDGQGIFSGCSKGTLQKSTPEGKLILRRINAHSDSINVVKCLDDNLLATGCDEGVVKIWDCRTRKCISKYAATDYISDVHYVNEKFTLLSTSGDGTLCAFDMRKKKAVFSENQDGISVISKCRRAYMFDYYS